MSDLPLAIGISLALTGMLGMFALVFPVLLRRAFESKSRLIGLAYLFGCVALFGLFIAGSVMMVEMVEVRS